MDDIELVTLVNHNVTILMSEKKKATCDVVIDQCHPSVTPMLSGRISKKKKKKKKLAKIATFEFHCLLSRCIHFQRVAILIPEKK